ncbi:MAG: sigma-54-dependent Fis family transcriptional regulator [Desulfobacterales bacterium]|nr:sigma-54-dependent Fis family transcriptional regulator [Desulfobacterales bacterium]MBF0395346.1 sigma-54-dependent Fis family transcriptional regulator [Desulfobacterales bacterium]
MSETLTPLHPILAVDDERGVLRAIDTTLRIAGFNNIITCQDSRQVMGILSKNEVEAVLLDLNIPHIGGEDLLPKINSEYPEIPIIIVTGALDIETAVRCMKAGAFDYVVKPVEQDRLVAAIRRSLDFRELKRENLALKQHIMSAPAVKHEAFVEIITNNNKMLSIFQYIESIAQTSQPVLITGDTGVGKELVAKAIHKLSIRRGRFVAVNAAGLDDNVFSDTLFGHVKGAFTSADQARRGLIELASGGTLFLDEIGDLSHASQVKLLRLLQEHEYLPLGQDEPKKTDARIVVATNKDLWSLQKAGKFRNDLIYRLQTHHVRIPPLHERLDDIPLLVDHFLEEAAKALKKKKPTPPKELYTLLQTYSFPGNIRELQAMVFDAVSRHKSKILSLDVFKSHIVQEQGEIEQINPKIKATGDGIMSFPSTKLPTIKQAVKFLVQEAMKSANNNMSIAAKILGISRQALSKRLKNLDADFL